MTPWETCRQGMNADYVESGLAEPRGTPRRQREELMPLALERKNSELGGERGGALGGERKYSGEAAPGATREAGTRVPPRALGETEKDHLWLGPGSLKPFLGRRSLLALRLESVDAAG